MRRWAIRCLPAFLAAVLCMAAPAHARADEQASAPDTEAKLDQYARDYDFTELMESARQYFYKMPFDAAAQQWTEAEAHLDQVEFYLTAAVRQEPLVNGVETAGVLDAVKETQMADLRTALHARDIQSFRQAYRAVIETCNGCHQSAGAAEVVITEPVKPPRR